MTGSSQRRSNWESAVRQKLRMFEEVGIGRASGTERSGKARSGKCSPGQIVSLDLSNGKVCNPFIENTWT